MDADPRIVRRMQNIDGAQFPRFSAEKVLHGIVEFLHTLDASALVRCGCTQSGPASPSIAEPWEAGHDLGSLRTPTPGTVESNEIALMSSASKRWFRRSNASVVADFPVPIRPTIIAAPCGLTIGVAMQRRQSALKKQSARATAEDVQAGYVVLGRIRLKLYQPAVLYQARKRQGGMPY